MQKLVTRVDERRLFAAQTYLRTGRSNRRQDILVDRLWPRGVRKDAATVEVWLREIAPSSKFISLSVIL
ncbi:MAG: DUF488 family protein [Firmicutes bacterium]|nr:DUF488 family protein [Bacillota bacterium]